MMTRPAFVFMRCREWLDPRAMAWIGVAYVFLATLIAGRQLNPAVFGVDNLLQWQQMGAILLGCAFVVVALVRHSDLGPKDFHRLLAPEEALLALLLLFYLYVMLSASWSDRPLPGLQKTVAFAITSGAGVLLALHLDAVRAFKAFGLAVVVMLVLGLPLGLAGSDVAFHGWERRFQGVYDNPNTLAAMGGLTFAVLAALCYTREVWWPVALVLGLFLVALVAWSGSTGGALTLIAVPLILYFASGAGRLNQLAWVVGAGLLVALLLLLSGQVTVAGEAVRVGEWSLSTHNRLPIWLFALEQWREAPWFGFGAMGFWTEARHEAFVELGYGRHANMHNGFMQVLIVGGVVGAVLFGAVLVALFVAARAVLRRGAHGEVIVCLVFVLAFLLGNLYEYSLLRATQFLQTLFTYAVCRVGYLYWTSAEAARA